MRDLEKVGWIYLKAALFFVIGIVSAALLIVSNPTLSTFLLLFLVLWSFCRLYYFAFYVIEKYVDPTFRFSGLFSAAKYFLENRS